MIEGVQLLRRNIHLRGNNGVGRRNSRGVTSRNPYDGGDQERSLAQKYRTDAESMQLIWPRTAAILFSIAKSYEYDAAREDREVDLRD